MADARKREEKRPHVFTLKLNDQELKGLQQLADRHFRRPGDELRYLLNDAIAREGRTT